MMDLDKFCAEAGIALGEQTADALASFVEKWVPIVTNAVNDLEQERARLNLALTEAMED